MSRNRVEVSVRLGSGFMVRVRVRPEISDYFPTPAPIIGAAQ